MCLFSKILYFSLILTLSYKSAVFSDRHTSGNFDKKAETMFYRKLLERNTTQPTNYTIMFSYKSDELSGEISYIQFDVNCNSTADIDYKRHVGRHNESVVQAIIQVFNGRNVTVMGGIYGYGASEATRIFTDPLLVEMYGDKMFESRSFTLVYAHNNKPKRNRIVTVGQRQPNDKLIKFESRTNVMINRFPESDFEFYDETKYLTCVRFSFNSPTAIAFLNTSFINDHRFNAVVYDLSRPSFIANISIYGYEQDEKSAKFKSII